MTEITLSPTLVVNDETKIDRALRILEKSEAACLISNSIKTVVKLEPSVSA
jgi:organic hydroperoxide reductase OsmC/OhrA